MNKLLLLLSAFLMPLGSTSKDDEINIAKSIEWLCAESEIIVTAEITSMIPTKGKRNTPLLSTTIEVEETIKGTDVDKTLYISIPDHYQHFSKRYQKGATYLFFLNTSIEAYGFEGHSYHTWPLMDDALDPYAINLEDIGTRMLGGYTKTRINDRDKLIRYCKRAIEELSKCENPEQVFLDLPWESEAFKTLYQGSACYLIVPDCLFPEAKKGLH